jgi:putative holliday junction resolvase
MANSPPKSRIVAIDYGLARIGMAISDERKIFASSLETIRSEKKLDKTVLKVAQELKMHQEKNGYQIEEIVIGLPLQMNGKMGMLADEVKQFAALLGQQIPCPIITWDERMTTVMAERSLRESSMTRKNRAKVVDAVTAVIILQSYLDSKGNTF